MAVRKYRVRWMAQTPEGAYQTKTKEFRSLRSAAEHVRDLPSTDEFVEVVAVDVGPLTEKERAAFGLFTDGKIVLS